MDIKILYIYILSGGGVGGGGGCCLCLGCRYHLVKTVGFIAFASYGVIQHVACFNSACLTRVESSRLPYVGKWSQQQVWCNDLAWKSKRGCHLSPCTLSAQSSFLVTRKDLDDECTHDVISVGRIQTFVRVDSAEVQALKLMHEPQAACELSPGTLMGCTVLQSTPLGG